MCGCRYRFPKIQTYKRMLELQKSGKGLNLMTKSAYLILGNTYIRFLAERDSLSYLSIKTGSSLPHSV